MKVLICGGRDFAALEKWPDGQIKRTGKAWEQYSWAYQYLNHLADERFPRHPEDDYGNYLYDVTIINGGAKGADQLAIDWAVINWTDLRTYKADWDTHGKRAGILRNIEMLEKEQPNLVIAFPGGRGTEHMVKIAKAAGIEVIEVEYESLSRV